MGATTPGAADAPDHALARAGVAQPLVYDIRRLPRPGRGRRQRVRLKLTITGGDNGEPADAYRGVQRV